MGLGTGRTHVLGRQQKFYAKIETTNGTFIKPLATDAVKVEETSIKYEMADDPIEDNNDYRYDLEVVQEKDKVTWSMDGYLIPSGTAATEPDLGPLFRAAMGANNSGAGSQWVYSVYSGQAWPTLSLVRHFNDVFMETIWGAWVSKMTIKVAAGQQPRVHFEGGAMGYAFTGASQLNGAMAASTAMIIDTADRNIMRANSVVKIGTQDNTGAGYRITAIPSGSITAFADGGGGLVTVTSAAHGLLNGQVVAITNTTSYDGTAYTVAGVTANTFNITATWVANDACGTWTSVSKFTIEAACTSADDSAVVPYVPTPTYVGSPIAGVLGSFQIATTTIPIVSAELNLENNFEVFEDEAFTQSVNDFAPAGKAKVTCAVGFRMRQDMLVHLANPREYVVRVLDLQCGTSAGHRYKFDMDYGRATTGPEITPSKDKAGMAQLTFNAFGSGANGPLTITHD